jgi:hypothetical protein
MTVSRRRLRSTLCALGLLAGGAAPALAQVPFPSDVTSPDARRGYRPVAAAASPLPAAPRRPLNMFLSPTSNPYLNPYLTTPMAPDAALLYMLAVQRESGGIGSGVPSGVRQAQTASSNSTPLATMPRSAAAPAIGAARYFHRGVDASGQPSAAYFNRSLRRMGR